MAGSNLQAAKQLVSLCFDPTQSALPNSREGWEELISLALYHGVAPLLWANLKDRQLPRPVRSRLWAVYTANLFRNQELKTEQQKVLAAFTSQAIPVWPLKGVELSETLYGDLGIRQVTDIDLLIQPHDLEKADRVLSDLGYARTVQDDLRLFRRSQELLYVKSTSLGSLPLDLHQQLLPYRKRDPLGERIRAAGMNKENLFLYLCVNHVTHRFARLKYCLDLKMLLDQTAPELNWDLIVSMAEEVELIPGIYYSLFSVRELAGGKVPASVLAALRPGSLDRKLSQVVLGRNPITSLTRGAALAGPYGAFAVLASTQGAMARLRLLWQVLFPRVGDLRAGCYARPNQATLPLYVKRLAKKIPVALWDLLKTVF